MPSPIAHSLAGGIIYFIWNKHLSMGWKPVAMGLFFCVACSNLLDLDFIPGIIIGDLNRFHHGFTHSFSFCFIVTLVTALIARFILKKSFWKIGALTFILLAVHLMMDFFTADMRFPYGVMLFWPFSNRYFISPVSIFPAYKKRFEVIDVINPANMGGYIYELLLLLPVIVLVIYRRRRKAGCTMSQ